ncbi:MAG: hypothetical protein IT454_10070 [Planctomycetes bacterium]|nr:hypothetical protein [Planctomycetota bacterium]
MLGFESLHAIALSAVGLSCAACSGADVRFGKVDLSASFAAPVEANNLAASTLSGAVTGQFAIVPDQDGDGVVDIFVEYSMHGAVDANVPASEVVVVSGNSGLRISRGVSREHRSIRMIGTKVSDNENARLAMLSWMQGEMRLQVVDTRQLSPAWTRALGAGGSVVGWAGDTGYGGTEAISLLRNEWGPLGIKGQRITVLSSESGEPLADLRCDPSPGMEARAIAWVGDRHGDLFGACISYSGSATFGSNRVLLVSIAAGQVVWTRAGDDCTSRYGACVASVPDRNGDGVVDIVIGSPAPLIGPARADARGTISVLSGVDGSVLAERSYGINYGQVCSAIATSASAANPIAHFYLAGGWLDSDLGSSSNMLTLVLAEDLAPIWSVSYMADRIIGMNVLDDVNDDGSDDWVVAGVEVKSGRDVSVIRCVSGSSGDVLWSL